MDADRINDYSGIKESVELLAGLFQSSEIKNAMQLMAEAVAAVAKQLNDSNLRQSVDSMATIVQKFLIGITQIELPKIEIPMELYKNLEVLSYLEMLKKIEWPYFLFIDDRLIRLLDPYKKGDLEDQNELKRGLIAFADDDFLNAMVQEWERTDSIDNRRIPALKEALLLYKSGYYYGCTTLITCQLVGVINDGYSVWSKKRRKLTIEDIKPALEYYNPGVEVEKIKLRSEKNELLAMVSDADVGFFKWFAAVGYIYKIILTSNENMNESSHPCRNKICHGIQFNYGTQEHALKAILTIDMTIKLCEMIKCESGT